MSINRRTFLRASGVLAAGAGTAGLLSACGTDQGSGGSGGSEIGGSISIYSNLTGSKKDAADALYAAFEVAHGVKVEVTEFGDVGSSHTKLLAAISSGTVPDLVINHYYLASVYAQGGHLLNVDDRLEGSNLSLDNFDERFLDSGVYEGERISLPFFASSRTLMYNATMAAEAGLDPSAPPKDWEELRTWAKAMTKRDGGTLTQAGLHLESPPGEYGENLFALLLWSAGGDLLSPDGTEAAFNTDAGRDALTFWHELIHQDKVFELGFTGPGGNNVFVGQAAGMTFGLNPIALFSDREGFDFGSLPIPAQNGGESVSMSDPFSLYAMKNGKNVDAAWTFMEFASAPEQQVPFCSGTYSLPANAEAQEATELEQIEQLTPFVDALDNAKPLPVTPHYVEFWQALGRQVESALRDEKSVAAALDEAEAEVNTLLAR